METKRKIERSENEQGWVLRDEADGKRGTKDGRRKKSRTLIEARPMMFEGDLRIPPPRRAFDVSGLLKFHHMRLEILLRLPGTGKGK